jgi:hypothetical protein
MTELLSILQALEAELHHPGVACSRERLECLLHPDFHEVGRSGRVWSRQDVIGFLAAPHAPPAVVSEAYTVAELAPGVALLCYRSAHRDTAGLLVDPALRSSVWLRTEVGWQLRYHQGTATAQ